VTAKFSTSDKSTYVSRITLLIINNVVLSQVSSGKILENNIPVFVITFSTQEVLLFRNAKTREVVVGAENKVEQCMYAAVVTRIEEELGNELTGGWKVIEVSLQNKTYPGFDLT
jgi:hypothetical protein